MRFTSSTSTREDLLRIADIFFRTISLGKYGSFPSNLIIQRPFHLTYEVQDKCDGEKFCRLRVVPTQELRAELRADEYLADPKNQGGADAESSSREAIAAPGMSEEIAVVEKETGKVVARTSTKKLGERERQLLTTADIELLKKDEKTSAGKDIVDRLLKSHQALEEKTEYSLEKYKLLKTRKYRRRFSIMPLDTPLLTRYLLEEKDSFRVLEMREEMVGLVGCWANVHCAAAEPSDEEIVSEVPKRIEAPKLTGGRWLCVEDTGGLLVAAMAERMGILYPKSEAEDADEQNDNTATQGENTEDGPKTEECGTETAPKEEDAAMTDAPTHPQTEHAIPIEPKHQDMNDVLGATNGVSEDQPSQQPQPKSTQPQMKKRPRHYEFPDLHIPYAGTNTITVLHTNIQPNLNFLKYYNYDIAAPHPPFATHPLYSNLICVNWLQLMDPEQDSIYANEPPEMDPHELAALKPGRRGIYHRKRRRWARTRYIVDSTRAGGFSGLVVASTMDPISILRYAIPLLAPGAPIAIYSPCVEPLTKLADCYSTARRSAWANDPPDEAKDKSAAELENWPGTEDFPLNPSLLLGTAVQTSSARKWQVLPGRTHPLMTGRGGAQGYVFTAWRSLPASGKVEARGKFKKRKTAVA